MAEDWLLHDALMSRDKGGSKLEFQLLIHPMVDNCNMTPFN